MCELEKYLRKEEIFEDFLKNVTFYYLYSKEDRVDINRAFNWARSFEGHSFWKDHYEKTRGLKAFSFKRLLSFLIPRFKEVV